MKKSAGIIFSDGISILLLKRNEKEKFWSIPGGKTEEGETEYETAVRETQEETGIATIPGRKLKDTIVQEINGKQFTTYLHIVDSPFSVKLSKEHTNYKWVKYKNLLDVKLHPRFRAKLKEILPILRSKSTNFNVWRDIDTVLKSL